MRLIDADALKEWVEEYHTSNWGIPQDELIYAIGSAQTIDPVKHGKLIASEETNSGGLIRMVCSECNRVVYSTYGIRLGGIRFCPYCGAKMERSEDEAD